VGREQQSRIKRGCLPVWVVERNRIYDILMAFQSKELLSRVCVPDFTGAIVRPSDEPCVEVAMSNHCVLIHKKNNTRAHEKERELQLTGLLTC